MGPLDLAQAGGKRSTTAADGKAVGISSGHQGAERKTGSEKRESVVRLPSKQSKESLVRLDEPRSRDSNGSGRCLVVLFNRNWLSGLREVK